MQARKAGSSPQYHTRPTGQGIPFLIPEIAIAFQRRDRPNFDVVIVPALIFHFVCRFVLVIMRGYQLLESQHAEVQVEILPER